MRYVLPVLIVATVCAVGAALSQVAADDAAKKPEAPGKPTKDEKPLLLLDDEPPLLLDDDPAGKPREVEGDA